ncbi:glycosyl hydrolase family 9 [Spirosoma sp. HMF4905]|uniref:Glycosyl hydrolase family 9 n=1 Tax=Spirosoma arboris TaxID=2682092 RepID=A0A7K1SAZ2_9BACT|nr:glycoside hydrolase family 9 protein [Spirosoma arboris]MVM30969.1 glycosyl hydrolase family 9 [Spirosoma arboris]
MTLRVLYTLLVACTASALNAQPPNDGIKIELVNEIIRSGVIHRPLPLDYSRSYEAMSLRKPVVTAEPLTAAAVFSNWKHMGYGKLAMANSRTKSGHPTLRLSLPTVTGKRAVGSSNDPDYATYGNCRMQLNLNGANWEAYNRLEFFIYPEAEGAPVVNINIDFRNRNRSAKNGTLMASADHLLNLTNNQWNRCYLDLSDLRRDEVEEIAFYVSLKGKNLTNGDSVIYYIDQPVLKQVKTKEISHGWMPAPNHIVYSTSGYMTEGQKTAIANRADGRSTTRFQLINEATRRVAYESNAKLVQTSTGEYEVLDFSDFRKAGNYHIVFGTTKTASFGIGTRIWTASQWRVLNYIFCQRCGYAVPEIHGQCHLDLFSEHKGQKISYSGGWHDAGDLSQQTLQTADVSFALLESFKNQRTKNPLLAARLREEAEWGLNFVLKNRYDDGYRASSMGLLIWQDGVIGTLDDIQSVRVQNNSFDTFLYAAYEAYAAMTLDGDPAFSEYLGKMAREDFSLAMKTYRESGYGGFTQMYEHSYNTSQSQYMATVSWAASMLYQLTGEKQYAQTAADFIRYTLKCQRTTPLGDAKGSKGFFYRDTTRKSIVHFVHQSRDQVYMQALILLCQTQRNHSDYPKWYQAVQLYGNYLKGILVYTAPYGMIPSGVYHKDEASDSASFYSLHLFPPANAKELYMEQLTKGVKLDEEHYLKRFPVWFSIFNGNTAVHLATGKAAAMCGNFLNDDKLLQIGREQLYWTVGKNPFGQSLIYGEGNRYPQMDSFSSGEITGEIPVGIRTVNNEDVPWWPAINNATYKEVWVTSAGKWLSLLAEY